MAKTDSHKMAEFTVSFFSCLHHHSFIEELFFVCLLCVQCFSRNQMDYKRGTLCDMVPAFSELEGRGSLLGRKMPENI